jgi:flagellar biosynthesis/type III secretory pathway protein FliH
MDTHRIRMIAPVAGVRVSVGPPSARRVGTIPAPPGKPAAAGRDEHQERIERLFSGLVGAVREVDRLRRESLDELRRLAVELSIAVASRLLFTEIEAGRYPIERLVGEAVARLDRATPVTLRLHPADLELLHSRIAGGPPWHDHPDVRLLGDAALKRGDCRADAQGMGVSAEFDAMLSDLRCHLLEGLG